MTQFVLSVWFCLSAMANDPHTTFIQDVPIEGHAVMSSDHETARVASWRSCVVEHGRACFTKCVAVPGRAVLPGQE